MAPISQPFIAQHTCQTTPQVVYQNQAYQSYPQQNFQNNVSNQQIQLGFSSPQHQITTNLANITHTNSMMQSNIYQQNQQWQTESVEQSPQQQSTISYSKEDKFLNSNQLEMINNQGLEDNNNSNHNIHWIEQFKTSKKVKKVFGQNENNTLTEQSPFIDYLDNPNTLFSIKNELKQNIQYPRFQNQKSNITKANQEKNEDSQQNTPKSTLNKQRFRNKKQNFPSQSPIFFHLKQYEMPQHAKKLQIKILNVVEKVRNTARETVNNVIKKSDLYNHSHYKLLFMKLNHYTIKKMMQKCNNIELHQTVFNIDKDDLQNYILDESISDKIEYINFIKKCIFEITNLHIKSQFEKLYQMNEEYEYEHRAFNGIFEMSNGFFIDQF